MRPLLIFLSLVCCLNLCAQSRIEISLWGQDSVPSNEIKEKEFINQSGHVCNSQNARLYVYRPDIDKNKGIAMVICPGGGYSILAIEHEGHQFAKWLAQEGITAAVLQYRLPNRHCDIPRTDAERAMEVMREKSEDWKFDPHKIGMSGFSAGGHLASTVGTRAQSSRKPDFMVLFYPVITMDKEFTHMGSKSNLIGAPADSSLVSAFSSELNVTPSTPPTLLMLSDDDMTVSPTNSILFYTKLKQHNVPASIHIFPQGGHGWGMRPTFIYHREWKHIMLKWLKDMSILDK
ncbi:MAG: alpha/beta hydrolase [Marinifilaceae bacterium]